MKTDRKVELLRRSYAAFTGLDLEAVIPLYDADCIWDMGELGGATGTAIYVGHAGLVAFARDISDVYPNWTPRIDELRLRSDGALLVRFTGFATARDAAMDLDMHGGQVVEFTDQKIERVTQTTFPPPGWDEAEPLE